MQRIDPATQQILAAFRANGAQSFEAFSPEESRQFYEENRAHHLPRIELPSIKDIAIPTRDNGRITLRFYDPRPHSGEQKITPATLYIHGGGWVVGSLETHDTICRRIAHETQQPLFAVDYRLAPEHPFPYPLYDCLDALYFIAEHAAEFSIDPHLLTLMGDSAGGNLATVIAHQYLSNPKASADYTVIQEILFYPVTTSAATHDSYQRFAEGYPLSGKTMHWFLAHYLPQKAQDSSPGEAAVHLRATNLHAENLRADYGKNPLVSPLALQTFNPSLASFIVTVGLDPLADEGAEYAAKLIQQGNFVEYHHLPDVAHGILTSAGTVQLGEEYLIKACQFITQMLQQSTKD